MIIIKTKQNQKATLEPMLLLLLLLWDFICQFAVFGNDQLLNRGVISSQYASLDCVQYAAHLAMIRELFMGDWLTSHVDWHIPGAPMRSESKFMPCGYSSLRLWVGTGSPGSSMGEMTTGVRWGVPVVRWGEQSAGTVVELLTDCNWLTDWLNEWLIGRGRGRRGGV